MPPPENPGAHSLRINPQNSTLPQIPSPIFLEKDIIHYRAIQNAKWGISCLAPFSSETHPYLLQGKLNLDRLMLVAKPIGGWFHPSPLLKVCVVLPALFTSARINVKRNIFLHEMDCWGPAAGHIFSLLSLRQGESFLNFGKSNHQRSCFTQQNCHFLCSLLHYLNSSVVDIVTSLFLWDRSPIFLRYHLDKWWIHRNALNKVSAYLVFQVVWQQGTYLFWWSSFAQIPQRW